MRPRPRTPSFAIVAEAADTMASRRFVVVLLFAAVVGVLAALGAWCFLEGTHQLQVGVFEQLPDALGYDTAPVWWPAPFAVLAGLIVAFAVQRLPGRGGHAPAHGLSTDPTRPVDLPGVLLASGATIGLGIVLGPEAPLIALGGALGLLRGAGVAPGRPAGAGHADGRRVGRSPRWR